MKLRILVIITSFLLACSEGEEKKVEASSSRERTAALSNRISVPSSVRTNLGITFGKAERRSVSSVIRVPGQFELLPTARRQYRINLPGRVELLVHQFQEVAKGDPLYHVNSPAWHRLRLSLEEAHAAIERTESEYKVAKEKLKDAERRVEALQKRISALGSLKVRRADLEGELSSLKSSLPGLKAEVNARDTEYHEALHHLPIQEAEAASALGITSKELKEEVEPGRPLWRTLDVVTAKAVGSGRVESITITSGSYNEENSLVLTTVQPQAIRFHASALQSDLRQLKEGLPARIVPPQGGSFGNDEELKGSLIIGLEGDPTRRTVDLFVVPSTSSWWSRAGVSGFLEVAVSQGNEEVTVPKAAIFQDGLNHYFFRRDPQNPDAVIKVEADLGASDGRWTEVLSGIAEGDEVVVEGVYELKLSSSGNTAKGGHFHADGSWHADGEPEKE